MIKAVLMDIDGTLLEGGRAVVGAAEVVRGLRLRGVGVRFLTNISARMPEDIAAGLCQAGIEAQADEVQTSTMACAQYLRSIPQATYSDFLVPSGVKPLFENIAVDNVNPQFVVVGDVAQGFTYDAMNRAFLMLRQGATLMAPHKNLYWIDHAGPRLDSGAFVTALEVVTGQSAIITGKPAAPFFMGAFSALGVTPAETLVIGDDISTDMAGAVAVGARSALVRTGKGRKVQTGASLEVQPEMILVSIADLPQYL